LRDRLNESSGPQRRIPDSALRSVAGEDAGQHEAPNIDGRCRIDQIAVADGVGQRGVPRRMSCVAGRARDHRISPVHRRDQRGQIHHVAVDQLDSAPREFFGLHQVANHHPDAAVAVQQLRDRFSA
jgi:hypothetical protein